MVTGQQASKKWENLKKKYKDLRTPKTGSGTDAGQVTAATWQYFEYMHEVLGARPSVDPPVVVASLTDEDPTAILMDIVEPSTATATATSTIETSPLPSTSGASAASPTAIASPSTPSPRKRKKKTNPIVDFLVAESLKGEVRCDIDLKCIES
ncbi:Angiopoietin-related protein 4 [Labeo rohita]|uniref:Angiopoietin-related protein 4 n=1 Tax=Labeo rohita TaxID=84645 RepID=A0ABQ8MIJ9_LABRO|nr:Angiopoietin-related protein 4 [Labeo rohita]